MPTKPKVLFVVAILAIVASLEYAYDNSAITGFVAGVLTLAFVAFIALLGFSSFWPIPPNLLGERRIWGWRDSRLVSGWTFWIPEKLGGKIETLSIKPQDLEDEIEVIVGDNVKLLLRYYLQFRADEKLTDESGPNQGRNTFLGTNLEDVLKKVKADIKSKLGALGGIRTSDDFKKHQKNIEDYLAASLRMSMPPHKAHGVSAERIIEFYEQNWDRVGQAISDEVNRPDDHSPLEESCGIDILAFRLMNPKFTPETEAAFEREKQERARARGITIQREEARRLMDELHISGEEALDAAQVALLAVPKKVVAVRGGGQAVIVEGGIPGLGGSGGGGRGDKGGSGGGRGGRR